MSLLSSKRLIKLISTWIFYSAITTLLAGCWVDTRSWRPIHIDFDGKNGYYNTESNVVEILHYGKTYLAPYCYYPKAINIKFAITSNKDFELDSASLISNEGSIYKGKIAQIYTDRKNQYEIAFDEQYCKDLSNYKLQLDPIKFKGNELFVVPPIQFKIDPVKTERNIVSPFFLLLAHP